MAGTSNWTQDETYTFLHLFQHIILYYSYEQMAIAYKGYKQCQDQRAALMLCRATPYGKYVNPEHCEKEAANFLECFHQS